MHFLLELAHFYVNGFARFSRRVDNRRDGQGIDVRNKSDSAANLSRRGHSLLHRGHGPAESKASGGREATLEKAASTQHRIQPQLEGSLPGEGSLSIQFGC